MTKVCTKCGEEKAIEKFGKHPWCRVCYNEYQKRWSEDNKQRRADIQKRCYKNAPEKFRARQIRWLSTHPEKYQEYNKAAASIVRRNREALAPTYIKQILKQKGFSKEQIAQNPELISIQKTLILIKRHGKQNQKST